MKQHPIVAELGFREMNIVEFEALVADIRDHGQQQPIVLYEGMILDGLNRWRAIKRMKDGRAPKTVEYNGNDPRAFAVSMNLERRHLSHTDRARVGLKIFPHYAKEAAKREYAGVKDPSPPGGEGDEAWEGKAAEKVGELVGVGKSTIERALFVQKHAPKLIDDDTEFASMKEKHAEAKRLAKAEKAKERAAKQTRQEREVAEEAERQKRILSVTKSLEQVANKAIDTCQKLIQDDRCKDLGATVKHFQAAAGSLRALLQDSKRGKAA